MKIENPFNSLRDQLRHLALALPLGAAVFLGSGQVMAQSGIHYSGPAAGDWNDTANWQGGVVPTGGAQPLVDIAGPVISASDTVSINGGFYIGINGGPGSVSQTGGSMTVNNLEPGYGPYQGTYTLSGGTLNLVQGGWTLLLGRNGNGTFNLEGGTLNSGQIWMGWSGGTGVFNMTGGTLNSSYAGSAFQHTQGDVNFGGGDMYLKGDQTAIGNNAWFHKTGEGNFTATYDTPTDTTHLYYILSSEPQSPVFTTHPQSQTVTSGGSVTFTAQATGYPLPTIAWHFIDSSSVDHLLPTTGNILTFTSNLSSAGQYYAVASNSAGTVNSTPNAVLTVNPNPFVVTASYSNSGFTVNTSEDLALNVSPFVSGPTYSTNLASLTDGLAPTQIPGYDGLNHLGNGAILTFDLGAEATINEIQSYSTWPNNGRVNQDYTVDFSQDGSNWTNGVIAVVNQGTAASGDWPGVKVSVVKNDSSPLASNARYVRFNFPSLQNGAVGFTEFVINGIPFALPEAPNFWETPQSQTVTSGNSVTFTAQATGYPVPVMTWHFIDSSSVDHLLSAVGSTLTFTSHLSSAGQYYAVASNSEGTVNSTPAAVLTVNPGIVENGDFSENAAAFTQGNSYFAAQSPGNPAAATAWTGGSGVNGTLGSAPDYFGPANHSIPSYLFMQGTQTVTQTITTTVGKSYLLSFKAACRENNVCGLTVWADNTKSPGLTIADGGLSGTNFQTYSFNFTGSGTQTIQFVNSGTGDFTADLTDVSVTDLGWADTFAAWINGLDWSAFTNPDKTATGDPDGDGMTNQQEYAFGLDPRHGSSVNPITQQLDNASGTFKYTRTKSSGLSYVYQYSTTLSDPWDAFASETSLPDSVSISDTVEEVTVTVPAALLNANSKLFVRVAAQ
jgi:hypothetical protein